jgi:2-C-methyl-D-erythritol 4-phosphate cytidylyltransferase
MGPNPEGAEVDGEVVAVVLAAGVGERLGASAPKAFLEIGGRPILTVAVAAAIACPEVQAIVVTVPGGMERSGAEMCSDMAGGSSKPVRVVAGGSSRQASVRAALAEIGDASRIVVCHDAARPLATPGLFSSVVRSLAAASPGVHGVIPVVAVADTLKRVEGDQVVGTEPRDGLRAAQTPQAFRGPALRGAHERAAEAGLEFTDDASVVEWAGGRVLAISGEPRNFKITTDDDLAHAGALLSGTAHA